MAYELVLLRHGESTWNAKNLFTGWVDVDLNDKGKGEAQRGGELLVEAGLPPEVVHTSVLRRALPYWYDDIVPDLRRGRLVLVAAHGNSLRAIVKHLDNIGDAEVVSLNIPTGIPLLYELDDDLKPVTAGGRYLDPEAAAASIEAVKNQGRK